MKEPITAICGVTSSDVDSTLCAHQGRLLSIRPYRWSLTFSIFRNASLTSYLSLVLTTYFELQKYDYFLLWFFEDILNNTLYVILKLPHSVLISNNLLRISICRESLYPLISSFVYWMKWILLFSKNIEWAFEIFS